MNVSDILLKVLAANGVRHLFGIPGDAINDVTDAVRRQDEIAFVQVRHEEAGAFAASAQAKLTGTLAACLGTAGPGAIHLLNGLYDAHLDHAPVIAITGQVKTRFIGTQYHQEVRLERLFADVAVYSQTVVSEEQVPTVFMEACRAAIAHRGVAHISLPANISGRRVTSVLPRHFTTPLPGKIVPELSGCSDAVALINSSERIAILAGIGCAEAREELIAFAQTLKAPIIRTLKAKEVIEDDHPMCIGGLGLLGGRPAVIAMDTCDLLIMVGSDFPYRDFYPKSGSMIQIDIEPTQIGKRHNVDIGLVGHSGPTLAALTGLVDTDRSDAFLKSRQDDMRRMLKRQEQLETSDSVPIAPPRVLSTLGKLAPDDAIFVCDTGTVTAWSARHLRLKPKQRYTLSGGLASMAFSFSGAIGAQLAYPQRRVFALAGDGAFAMLMGDFITAVKYDLPIVVVVLNNRKLAFIALEQNVKGLPEWGTELKNADFAAVARACGGLGHSVERPEDLEPAIKQAIAAARPTVIDIAVDPDALIIPPEIKLPQAVGFTFAKLREFFGE
jgi:pyruvate oxidase